MDKKVVPNIEVENAHIVFRNFSGKAGQFNPAGRRNFCVLLDTPIAKDLLRIGWNIRWLEPRDPGAEKQAYLQVSVSYLNKPPRIIMITDKGKTILDEEMVQILDWAEIKEVDLVINPYNWEVNDKHGIKAYLKAMYVTLVEDDFAAKYRDVPDAASSAIIPDAG